MFFNYAITNFVNLLLGTWGNLSAGSAGYYLAPGVLPNGS